MRCGLPSAQVPSPFLPPSSEQAVASRKSREQMGSIICLAVLLNKRHLIDAYHRPQILHAQTYFQTFYILQCVDDIVIKMENGRWMGLKMHQLRQFEAIWADGKFPPLWYRNARSVLCHALLALLCSAPMCTTNEMRLTFSSISSLSALVSFMIWSTICSVCERHKKVDKKLSCYHVMMKLQGDIQM